MPTIVPAGSSQSLAASLAAAGVGSLTVPSYERFADGETLAAVPEFAAESAIVVASTIDNDSHIELLQLQDAVREAGAREVTTVIPYLGYGRQDEAFKDGEPVSARAVARAISTGTDHVVLVDPHEAAVTDFFSVPTTIVEAAGELVTPLPDLTEPLFLAPDEGATELAETARDAYGNGEVDYFTKQRDYDTGDVELTPSDAAVTDRDIVVVDDIIATGGTMSGAIEVLNERGAADIYACCIHPVLAGAAQTKLAAAGVERVIGTDTIECAVSEVSVAPVLADVLAE